ncbi:oligoribonuclease [Candidatus Saccharibacteria bacterium]|nr:oligoribonuclease [Candidatus Saccharibacteria bacterium]
MSITKVLPTKLLWMDLEFTGFDYSKDVIIEVSAEITDFDFRTIASYESRIRNNPKTLVDRMRLNTFWQDHPENRDNFVRNNDEGKPLAEVEQDLIELVEKYFGTEPAVLAGNSIHSDRSMIKSWWPGLDLRLHYRMLDVTGLKIIMQGKYGVEYEKQNTHRAYDDIQESIAELQYYLDWLQQKT